jgi:hypothetical protein
MREGREWCREEKVEAPIGEGGSGGVDSAWAMARRIGAARRSAPEGKGVATWRRPSRRDDGLGVDEDK